MVKLRRGELKFYKTMTEHEINEYVKEHPENKKYVKSFIEKWNYNWVKEKWTRRK